MADDFDTELGALLDQYDEKRRAVAARMRQVKADEVAFLDEFAHLRRSVVRPVFEAIGAALRARGHEFIISEEDYTFHPGGKATEASISIRIVPAATEGAVTGPDASPALAFATRHYSKAVEIHADAHAAQSGGFAGPRGEYQLAQITTQLVRGELLKVLAEMVRK